VDLNAMITDLKAHFESGAADARKFAEEYLPGLADLADKASTNPLAVAALNVVHVSPDILSGLADTLMKLDAELAQQQEATAAAQSALAAATAPPEPAEPEPAESEAPAA
jgi:hypothetical protein